MMIASGSSGNALYPNPFVRSALTNCFLLSPSRFVTIIRVVLISLIRTTRISTLAPRLRAISKRRFKVSAFLIMLILSSGILSSLNELSVLTFNVNVPPHKHRHGLPTVNVCNFEFVGEDLLPNLNYTRLPAIYQS